MIQLDELRWSPERRARHEARRAKLATRWGKPKRPKGRVKRGLHKVPKVAVPVRPVLTPAQVRAQFKRRVKIVREGMLSRDPACKWCYRELNARTLTVDHVLAIADGGTNHYTNLVPACGPCNAMRGSLVARRQKMLDKLAKRSIAA